MCLIYEPQGKAREYSPLALNIYSGCDHGCTYCYVPNLKKRFHGKNYNNYIVKPRSGFISKLKKEAKKHYNSKEPVLLCFTTDPYCIANNELQITKQTLEILLENKIPVSILTKGGLRSLQDIELFKKFGENIQVGTTLTFDDDCYSLEYEPRAALPQERLEMLKKLSENNIKTWVSIEPVIDPKQSFNLIEKTINYVDKYKIGKLNHNKTLENKIDWYQFLVKVVTFLRKNNKKFYIKKDLAAYQKDFKLYDYETDMDYLNLKSFENKTLLIK